MQSCQVTWEIADQVNTPAGACWAVVYVESCVPPWHDYLVGPVVELVHPPDCKSGDSSSRLKECQRVAITCDMSQTGINSLFKLQTYPKFTVICRNSAFSGTKKRQPTAWTYSRHKRPYCPTVGIRKKSHGPIATIRQQQRQHRMAWE